MKRFSLLAAVVFAMIPAPAGVEAFGYEESSGYGTLIPGGGPSTLSLSGARAIGFGDPISVFNNPSDLSRIDGSAISIATGIGLGSEVLETYSRTTRNELSLGATSACYRLNAGPALGFGAGIAKLTDLAYSARQYTVDDSLSSGDIISMEGYESSGGVWEVAAGGGTKIFRWLRGGASIGYRFGSADFSYEFDDRGGEDDSLSEWGWEEEAVCAHLGLSAVFGLNSVGISYTTESDHYPARVAAGCIFYSGGASRGALGFEGEITDPSDSQIFTGRVFGLVTPSSGFEMRGGLSFTDRGSTDEKRTQMGFSFGVAVTLGRAVLEGAFAMNKSSRDNNGFGFSDDVIDQVSDTASFFSIGMGCAI